VILIQAVSAKLAFVWMGWEAGGFFAAADLTAGLFPG
jgi:hypothetical protein